MDLYKINTYSKYKKDINSISIEKISYYLKYLYSLVLANILFRQFLFQEYYQTK